MYTLVDDSRSDTGNYPKDAAQYTQRTDGTSKDLALRQDVDSVNALSTRVMTRHELTYRFPRKVCEMIAATAVAHAVKGMVQPTTIDPEDAIRG